MVFWDSSLIVLNSHVLLKSAMTDSVSYCALSVFTNSRDNEPAMLAFRDAVIRELKERFGVRASAQCGPDPGAFRGAADSCCTWFRSMVRQQLTSQLRRLDRVCACDTIRSRRCHRCTICGRDTPLRDLVGGTLRPIARPPISNLLRTPARYQTAFSETSFSQNVISSYSPNFAMPPRWHSHAAPSLDMPRHGHQASKEP